MNINYLAPNFLNDKKHNLIVRISPGSQKQNSVLKVSGCSCVFKYNMKRMKRENVCLCEMEGQQSGRKHWGKLLESS